MKKLLNGVGNCISGVIKVALGLLVILLVLPLVYFIWRAGQPMDMPQYDRRTYYELLIERKYAYDVLAEKYQASHPNMDVNNRMCFTNEVMISVAYTLPWAGVCAMSGMIPSIEERIGARAKNAGCLSFVSSNPALLLENWWKTYEKMVYVILTNRPHDPVAYCRALAP